MAEFGEQLRKAREGKGMTQQTLAEKVYVTRQAVSRWECGDRFPDLITTKKISQILDVSIDDLLSENEMKSITERNPIIEKPILNNIVAALYACITFSFLITVVDIMIRFPLESPQINFGDIHIITVNLIGLILQTSVFSYGLIMALQGILSPKRTGIIATIFFLSVSLADLNQVFDSSRLQLAFITILLVAPSIAGAISSYLYYCKSRFEKVCIVIIVVASFWGILRMLINTYMTVKYAGQFVTMNIALGLLLKSCIYLLFIYQVYTLNRKRHIVLGMSQDK